MALIIEGGISIGGNITITPSSGISPTANLVVFYDAGNSMCYNGSGSTFSPSYTGPNLDDYYQYGVVDLAGLTGGPWNGTTLDQGSNVIAWTSQGVASYFSFDAPDNNYLDSTYQQDNNATLNSPTYTILAVVRPQDFTQGAIVGGDQNVFAFVPTGGVNDGPTVVAGNSYGPPSVMDGTNAFELDTWYCVAVTYDAGTGLMKLYTNGELVNTSIPGVPAIDHPTGLYWGTLEGELWFTGDLAVGMVWERVLGADEISQLSTAFLSRYVAPPATSSVVYTQPYLGGEPGIFTVPEGVTSISVVTVGAGGSGTADSYSAPGTDSIVIRNDNYVDNVPITNTGSSNNLVIDSTAYPNIANVTGDGTWIVGGSDVGTIGFGIPKWDLVTAVDTTDPGNVVITLNNTVNTTAGDTFFFYQAVAAAEGGYEITESSYSGPAPQPLVGSGGAGGLVDPSQNWPIGGGGAGGYTGAGGQGTTWDSLTATAGSGGAGGGGGGRQEDSGGGGGGTDIYGQGNNGAAGTFDAVVDNTTTALGGSGGSQRFAVDGNGGQATAWNGGRGGWPGGGGASATGYWDGGLGGALAYRNNYAVTAGEQYIVLVGAGGLGQNNGGSGADGAVRIVWPGDTRRFPSTLVGPDEVAVPTLAITDYNFPAYNPNGTVEWNIASDGNGTVLETGIVWGMPGQATYLDSVDVCDDSSSTAQRKAIRAADSCSNPYTTGLTGTQTLDFHPDYHFYDETIDVRVYARNAAGVAYSPTTLTWTPRICLAEGTLVTLADGNTKAIESITMTDLIKVWDFDTAVATSATPLWIKRQETTTQYNLIKFSDGSELKTIGQHRIFNKQAGAFTYPMTEDTPVGTTTVKADGSEVTVVSKQVVYSSVNYYNVVTSGGYMNLYANAVLTSMRYNNIYPIANMQYSKDGRTLRDRSEFAGIADRWIDGLRLPEQTIDIEHIRKYVDRLERNEQQEITTPKRPAWHK
jgi:hypothetical protein